MREWVLAPERITTQCREKERTQGDLRCAGDDPRGAGFIGDAARALAADEPSGGAAGDDATALVIVAGATRSGMTLSVSATVVAAGALSALSVLATIFCRAMVVSAFNRAEADGGACLDRTGATS